MTYRAKVIAGGKIVIPADLRRELGIRDGDSVVIGRDDVGGITLRTSDQIVRDAQRRFREMVGPDYSVEQFLAERRADWGEE
jgi:AbrB family transcriptional regulator, stage V sporulation protein T